MKGVNITRGKIGANASGRTSATSILIANGVAVVGKLALLQCYTLYSADDAEALGITPAYDAANEVLLHHHIDEFYRGAGPGTALHIMVVAQSVLPAEMLEDTGNIYIKKLIAFAKGEARQMALAYNPPEGYTETVTDGFNSDIRAAIIKAQALYEWADGTDRPLHILLEGRAFSGNAATAINLKQLEAAEDVPLHADKVSICIGQDYGFADALTWPLGKKYAAVGTLLGTLASIQVNQNVGEVETLDLTNATKGKFTIGGLSSHAKIEDSEAMLDTLETKGYIFPMTYTGISGYRWNNDHVCAPEIVDSEGRMNESTIAYGRTMDAARRGLRVALLPKVKTVQPVNPTTGLLPLGVVKYFDGLGDTVFEAMQAGGLISEGRTATNPNSNLLVAPKALEVGFVIVPTGTVNEINGTINLKTSF